MYKRFAAAVLAVSITSAAMAEDKKAAGFLAASSDAQVSYINASLAMAQALLSNTQAQCISKWASENEADGFKIVIDAVKKYSDHHPSAVVAAMIEKTCGNFELAQR